VGIVPILYGLSVFYISDDPIHMKKKGAGGRTEAHHFWMGCVAFTLPPHINPGGIQKHDGQLALILFGSFGSNAQH